MPASNSPQQDDRLVIGVTGRIGAGKTSVSRHLSNAHGFQYVRYSQVLSDWRANDPESKAHLQAIGWEVMSGGMQTELNKRLIGQLQPRGDAVVDGLRHPIDFESLQSSFASHFRLLFIECPEAIRWQRLRSRLPTLEEFRRADSHPVEQQIESLRERAFAVVSNDSSLQDIYSKVDLLLHEIRQGGQS